MVVLRVEDLVAGYGNLKVLFGANLEVRRREIVAVVGPNGSGKSTLLKAIAGLATVFSGKILFDGVDMTAIKPHDRARMGLAYLPQTDNVFSRLTVKENLILAGYTVPKDEFEERLKAALEFLPRVRAVLHRKVWTLSGGERQMVAIAMAVIRKPRLVMLDEPSASLAPKVAAQIFDKIVELRDRLGLGVVLVEQNARKALEISDKALLLVAGRPVFWGPSHELRGREDLLEVYLGVA